MLRITLSSADRATLDRLRHGAKTPVVLRARCQMLSPSADGWSPPKIAAHLACPPHTVRAVLRRFQARGGVGLTPDLPGRPPDTARREQVTAALDCLPDQERTWTAAQLAAALGEQGIALSTRQTRKYLGQMGAKWRRTVRTLAHKQDPERGETAQHTLAALRKGPRKTASASPSSTSVASSSVSR